MPSTQPHLRCGTCTTNERTFVHDAAGNISQDMRAGTTYDYSYNKRNRLKLVSVGTVQKRAYTYIGLEQVTIRALTNMTSSGSSLVASFSARRLRA